MSKKYCKLTKILIPIETASGERRVSATPGTIKKLKGLGCEVFVESSAGELSGFNDTLYKDSGGEIVSQSNVNICGEADIVFCVQTPSETNLNNLKKRAILIGLLNPYANDELQTTITRKKITALSME